MCEDSAGSMGLEIKKQNMSINKKSNNNLKVVYRAMEHFDAQFNPRSHGLSNNETSFDDDKHLHNNLDKVTDDKESEDEMTDNVDDEKFTG